MIDDRFTRAFRIARFQRLHDRPVFRLVRQTAFRCDDAVLELSPLRLLAYRGDPEVCRYLPFEPMTPEVLLRGSPAIWAGAGSAARGRR